MALIFLDDFNRADGVLGNGWPSNGYVTIVSNKAYAIQNDNYGSYRVADFGTQDYKVTATFDLVANAYITHRFVVRSQDQNMNNVCQNGIVMEFHQQPGIFRFDFGDMVGGSFQSGRSTVVNPTAVTGTVTLTLSVYGSTTTIFLNDRPIGSVPTTISSGIGAGFRLGYNRTMDNFTIETSSYANDGRYATITYASGRIFSSSDYGNTWTLEDPMGTGLSYYWASSGISIDGNVMVATTNRTVSPINSRVFIKKDGYWADRTPNGADSTPWNCSSMSPEGKHILVGGNYSSLKLAISHNYGASWTQINTGAGAAFTSCAINKDGTKFIAGQDNGRLWYSSNGSTITEVQPKGAVNGNWYSVAISYDGTRLMASDSGGKVYYSSDSGANWTNQALNGDVNSQWATVAMSDDGAFRLAGGSFGAKAWLYETGAWTQIYPGGNNDNQFKAAATNFAGTVSHMAIAHNTGGTWYRNKPNFNLVNNVAGTAPGQYWSSFSFSKDDGSFPVTNNKTITAKARIQKVDVTKTITARARVKYTGVVKTIDAKARIQNPIYTGYSHFMNLTVDYTKVWDSTHTNFTVLVKTTQSFLRSVSNGGHVESTSGYDIIFGSTDGFTQYPHELVRYVPTTGECIFWVKIPSISNVANTSFRMWYGNPGIVTPTENKPNTWDTYHKAVYHLQETSGNAIDSTVNANNMTPTGGITYSQPGIIGNSVQFNGTNALFYRPTIFGTGVDEVTMSGWMNATVFGSNPREVIHHGDNVSVGLEFYTPGILHGQVLNTTGGWKGISQSGKSLNTWYKITLTAKQNNFINVYINGVSIGAPVASNTWFDPGPNYSASIGAYKEVVLGELYHFNGKVEEARFANTVRSAGWIKTEYYNETDPNFITYSGEHISINVTVSARARIKNTATKTVSSKARIKYTGVNTSVTARANITQGGTHIFGDEGLIY